VDAVYDALEYEFVDAVTATNRAVFKATKEADDVSAQAAKALWKTTLNIDPAAEKAAFFEPNRAVMRATRVLAMVPGNADALRAVRYEAGSDAIKKLQLHEQKLMQLENDLIQTQEKFASICTLTENGMTTVSNLEGQEEPVGSVLADVFAHRSRVAFSRVLLLSRFSAMRSGLGDDQPPPPSVGGKAISMQEEIEWVIPKTGRFTAHDDSRAAPRCLCRSQRRPRRRHQRQRRPRGWLGARPHLERQHRRSQCRRLHRSQHPLEGISSG
jgi:hypothetical protein